MDDISEGYNETELGVLPETWSLSTIRDIFEIKQGKQISSKEDKTGKIKKPFLRTSNLGWGSLDLRNVDEMFFTEEEFEKLKLTKGDILVCEGGDIGRTAMFNDESGSYAYQNHLHRLRCSDDAYNNTFFVLWMNHAINQRGIYVSQGNRTTIPNLSSSRLGGFVIPKPSLPEQQKIAHVLSTIQETREKTDAVFASLRELKKSMMKHLFTYGPVSVEDAVNVKLKDSEIGMVPKEWGIIKIGEVAKFQGGYAFKSDDYVKKGVRLFKIANVSFGKTTWQETSFLPNEYMDAYKNYVLRAGDLVMAMTRPIVSGGIKITKLSEIDCPCLLNQRVGRFVLSGKINTEFLFQMLFNRFFVESMGLGATGSQQPNISANQIENIHIPLPPLETQQRIAKILSVMDCKIEAESIKKRALEHLFDSMLHNLMTAKVRVNELTFQNA